MRNVGSAERGVEWVHDTKANATARPDVRLAKDRKLLSFMKRVLVDGAVQCSWERSQKIRFCVWRFKITLVDIFDGFYDTARRHP